MQPKVRSLKREQQQLVVSNDALDEDDGVIDRVDVIWV